MAPKVDASTAKRSMGQFDGKCKTLVNEAKTFAATHAAGLTEGGKKKAANLEDELKNQFSRMERRWDEFGDDLEINDQTTFNDLDRKVQAARQAVKEAKDALYDLIDKPTVVAHAAQPAQAPKMAPKLVTNFKPGILPSSTNLNEFNAWEKSFVAYMDANKDFLAASANQTKRIFVTTLLDAKIQGALDADETMSADTIPIKSDNEDDVTLLKWLRTYILRYLPLYIRRYHYSLVKQLPKESFQDFLQRKILKGRECDLENINAEAVQITELIIGINNNKLREDFLKLKDPKLADLIDLGLQSDLATAVKKDNFGEASVNKTSEYQNSKKLNWNANKNNSNHGKILVVARAEEVIIATIVKAVTITRAKGQGEQSLTILANLVEAIIAVVALAYTRTVFAQLVARKATQSLQRFALLTSRPRRPPRIQSRPQRQFV